MGNTIYRVKNLSHSPQRNSHAAQYHRSHTDYGAHSHALTTTNAPWNVTQWIDPIDPHPKVPTGPIFIVVRR